jgi:hypothetical protein
VLTSEVADFKEDMDRYLSGLDDLKCKTLEEIVEFNKAHFKEALTDGTYRVTKKRRFVLT